MNKMKDIVLESIFKQQKMQIKIPNLIYAMYISYGDWFNNLLFYV